MPTNDFVQVTGIDRRVSRAVLIAALQAEALTSLSRSSAQSITRLVQQDTFVRIAVRTANSIDVLKNAGWKTERPKPDPDPAIPIRVVLTQAASNKRASEISSLRAERIPSTTEKQANNIRSRVLNGEQVEIRVRASNSEAQLQAGGWVTDSQA
jgi:hypothetical protein